MTVRSSSSRDPPGAAANASSSVSAWRRSSAATAASSAETMSCGGRIAISRVAPAAPGTCSSMRRCHVADARAALELLLEPELGGDGGQEVPDASERPAPAPAHGRPTASGTSTGAGGAASAGARSGPSRARPTRRSRARRARGRGRRSSSSSRSPAGSASMRRTRCERRSGSSSLKTSSSRSSGGLPSSSARRSSSASFSARIALRCWPRDANDGEVAAGALEDDVVAMRSHERGAVPDLLLGGLAQAAPERRPVVLALGGRGVRQVARRRAAARRARSRRCAAARGAASASSVARRHARSSPPLSQRTVSQYASSSREATSSRIRRRSELRWVSARVYVDITDAAVGSRCATSASRKPRRSAGAPLIERHVLGREHDRPQHARRSSPDAAPRRRSRTRLRPPVPDPG